MLNRGVLNKLKDFKEDYFDPIKYKNRQKYFCIGLNKTGTTSLKRAFQDLGFKVGNQRKAERLLKDIINRNYNTFLNYCDTAEVFQDVPFSFFDIYKVLFEKYPDAKFILTIRDSPEQWVNSITKFHAKKFSNNCVATAEELKRAEYVWPGWMWEAMKYNFDVSEQDPYNRENLQERYIKYNREAKEFFSTSDHFIELNLSQKESYQKFTNFIGVDSPYLDFPWENKTENIKAK
ncbi:sulfotransferase [Marivirga tractuosa]|uniref:sulfotransferase n=1 Tax=Marivirga tractuosa TaxID=1006 RepID=UPI0035CFEE31